MYFRTGGRDERSRYQYNYLTVMQYLKVKCFGKSIVDFFKENNMKHIAVYGIGELGCCIVSDLFDSEIGISYIVDQAYKSHPNGYKNIPVVGCEKVPEMPEVDCVVISVPYDNNLLTDNLVKAGIDFDRIINITDVVFAV